MAVVIGVGIRPFEVDRERPAEIGTEMDRSPPLGTWSPGPSSRQASRSPQGRQGDATTGHDNRYLARVPGSAATSAGRTDTFLGERYRRIPCRRGSKKAVLAVGRSMLVVIWHLLTDPAARHTDLGSDLYDTQIDPERRKRNHIRQLQAPGYTVTLEPAA